LKSENLPVVPDAATSMAARLTDMFRVLKVWSSNLGQAKSDTA